MYSRKDINPYTSWGKLLFARSKIPHKKLVQYLKTSRPDLNNFKIVEIADLYTRFKSTNTYRFALNKDVIEVAYSVAHLDPNSEE